MFQPNVSSHMQQNGYTNAQAQGSAINVTEQHQQQQQHVANPTQHNTQTTATDDSNVNENSRSAIIVGGGAGGATGLSGQPGNGALACAANAASYWNTTPSGDLTGQQPILQQQQHSTQVAAGGSNTSVTLITTVVGTGTSTTGDTTNIASDSSPRESGDDSEDESEILEESPCGRWLKRREEVDQRDVPGIDCVHLAMDTEEGVEVVWNEVQYTSLQELKTQEEKMRQVFDNLLQLDHQNIVKFHRYWTDTQNAERPRVIFITEYMSSGSLKQFLKRTKRNAKRLPLEAWRRWCTQILSALSYLHSCTPPVIHGNLTCDSIFIQHNGLVKIGSVVPDAVHYSVHRHKVDTIEHGSHYFMAPEYGAAEQLTAAVDIYAFGMCALEMAALEIQTNSGSETNNSINEETILRTINSLEHDLQRDLIFKCLRRNPTERPTANDLLFHPLLFEVHSLKLLSAHCLVFAPKNRTLFSETLIDGMMQRYNRPDVIMAVISPGNVAERTYRLSDVPSADKLEKFVEDVKYGVYPLTALGGKKPPHFRSRAASPERIDSVKSATPEPVDIESRRIVNMMCSVKKLKEDSNDISMTILLRMDDKMNRQLTCQVTEDDSALDLTNELVRLGFVHIDDQDKIQALLEETLSGSFADGGTAFEYGAQPLTFSATINEPHPIHGNTTMVSTGSSDPSSIKISGNANVTQAMSNLNQLERNWSVADTEFNVNSNTVGGALLQPQKSMSSISNTVDSKLPSSELTISERNWSVADNVPVTGGNTSTTVFNHPTIPQASSGTAAALHPLSQTTIPGETITTNTSTSSVVSGMTDSLNTGTTTTNSSFLTPDHTAASTIN